MAFEEYSEEQKFEFSKLQRALENNDLDKIFLGDYHNYPQYYIPWSRWDMYDTGVLANLESIQSYLYDYIRFMKPLSKPGSNVVSNLLWQLGQTLHGFCDLRHTNPLKLYIVAYFIYGESAHRNYYQENPLRNFDLETLAHRLSSAIRDKKDELKAEKRLYGGSSFEDGVYGRLRSLAELTVEKNGPNFFPEWIDRPSLGDKS